jgi:hypothetical protein
MSPNQISANQQLHREPDHRQQSDGHEDDVAGMFQYTWLEI